MPVDPSARVWPFHFSRSRPVSVERTYRTTIFRSESGREQRRAHDDQPRMVLEFDVAVTNDCYRRLLRELHGHQPVLYALPDWTRGVASTSALAAAGTDIDLASIEPWAVAGESLLLVSKGRIELYTVDSIAGQTVTLLEANAGAEWPIGTKVYAGLPVRLSANLACIRPLQDTIVLPVVAEVVPTTWFYIEPPAAPVTFNGREVFNIAPTRLDPVGHDFLSGIETVDTGFGAKAWFQPVGYPAEVWDLDFTGCSKAKAQAIEDVFVRNRGRQGEFYLPSWQNDLIPDTVAGAGTSSLIVKGDDVSPAYGGSSVFKAIAVRFNDNTFEFNTVVNVTPGAGVATLTVGNNWARAIDPATVRRISWMPVCRFAADTLKTEWPLIDRGGRMSLAVQTLEDLPTS